MWTISGTLPLSIAPQIKPYVAAVHKYVPGGALGADAAGTLLAGEMLKYISKDFGSTVTSADITHDLLAQHKSTYGGLTPPLTFPSSSNRVGLTRARGCG
jgi:hypothetical protein